MSGRLQFLKPYIFLTYHLCTPWGLSSDLVCRKVKCNEEQPLCGNCRRLRLTCSYQCTTRRDSSVKARNARPPTSPTPWQDAIPPSGVSTTKNQDPINHRGDSDNTAQTQSQGLGVPPLDFESSAPGGFPPNVNFDTSMRDPHLQQSFTFLDHLEMELLGEDSLCKNNPILSNPMSTDNHSFHIYGQSLNNSDPHISNSFPQNFTLTDLVSAPSNVPISVAMSAPIQSSDETALIPTTEIDLLRHFVDFAVPPILIGVEPQWHKSRDALLRLSKTYPALRHSICAFSALSLGESTLLRSHSMTEICDSHSNIATVEVERLLDSHYNEHNDLDSQEAILGSIFFLSYVDIVTAPTTKKSVKLLDQAHALVSRKKSSSSSLESQLQIWLKLLDAKIVSAGGRGFHLYTTADLSDLEIIQDGRSSTGNGERASSDDIMTETEDLLFTCLNRQAYKFYLQVLGFSGRIASLDKWHRSRGTVDDELEVMLAAKKLKQDLHALWARRPAIIDLAIGGELQKYVARDLSTKLQHHLRTYAANFFACFIHLQRVAYTNLQGISEIDSSVTKVIQLSRITLEEGQSLPVSMLWPLMMAACEAKDEDLQLWIIECIDGMQNQVGNAPKTAKLVREIVERQKAGQRADARTVMQESLGHVFAII